jgi:hypothetical protein
MQSEPSFIFPGPIVQNHTAKIKNQKNKLKKKKQSIYREKEPHWVRLKNKNKSYSQSIKKDLQLYIKKNKQIRNHH